MTKIYFVISALSELFHYRVFVNSSSCATNKASQAILTNMKNESSNVAKENKKTPEAILRATLDEKSDEDISWMTCKYWIDRFVRDVIFLGEEFITENEWMKARQQKKGKKQVVMDITTPRMTNVKEMNRFISGYIKRDYGNNETTVTREHAILETRQQIFEVMLQSEFLVKIFLQLRRTFYQSRIQPMRRY
ncbi:uncharacterized protein LOC135842046 [Planococcus citri]|uniref:uncharacterized protein LOC135842046 n=1 Tax=Planococcus citri TaxID=170843 RepID=UPI0031F769FE